jgi:hypothetical protein
MVDFKFVDAKWDRAAEELTVRVKIWNWSSYTRQRTVNIWDFTLYPDRSGSGRKFMIRKVWQVDERELAGYHAFPSLKFEEEP